jgi:hypothetical protein
MVRTLGVFGLVAIATLSALACSQIAGIANFRDGEPDAGDGGNGSGSSGDGPASPGDGAAIGSDGSGTGGDASPPSNCAPQVGLLIQVADSTPGRFTGISDGNNLFPGVLAIGQPFSQCVPIGTMLDLQAEPGDPSDAVHDWGVCGLGRRCGMTIQTPTVLDVDLR